MSVFRNKFSEDIFNYKYRHEGCETWEKLSDVIVDDVCRDKMSKEEKSLLKKAIREMKFLPGGRYIYYAGREIKAFNNCFSGDTKLLTDNGFVQMGDVVGQKVKILSPVDGEFKDVEVHSHGIQPVQEITFAPIRGSSKITYKVKATRTHHWLLTDGSDTYDIRVGDVVPANTVSRDSAMGFIHGLIFGDGTLEYERADGSQVHKIRLCEKASLILPKLLACLKECEIEYAVAYPETYNGDPQVRIQGMVNLKSLPETKDIGYVSGFLRGWVEADASEITGKKICSVNEAAIDYFIEHGPSAGFVITGVKRSQVRDTAFAKNHRIFILNYDYGESYEGFKVKSICLLGEEEVFCPFEPEYQQIVIDHGIHTFNCYLLRAESDTREDWAMLSWKAESCLSTGGGIGVDYSIYRPKDTPLKRTGGQASGPVSKMRMINEIGREVMQGGSRRSAIYASLNWQHQDIQQFLYSKDWFNMKVPGTDKTFWDCKVADFNFAAPLDMTNISANYDDAWLNTPDRHKHPTFLANCRQAMMTGEPGWSFNFGDKQNETLRNACVPFDTRILTRDGYQAIGELVGQTVEVWNGEEWSSVTPKSTGRKTTYLVILSNGASLRCSGNHEWLMLNNTRKQTEYLTVGEKIEKYSMPVVSAGKVADFDAYSQGFYSGDGNDGYEFSWVYPPKQNVCSRLTGKVVYEKNSDRHRWTHGKMLGKGFVPTEFDLKTRIDWIAGLLDADACINVSKSSIQVQLASINFEFLREVQLLLTTLGVCSSVTKMRDEEVRDLPDGRGGVAPYACASIYRLHLGNGAVCQLKSLGLSTCRIDLSGANPDATDNSRFYKIASVEEVGEEDVYCFDEPLLHQGTFEGIVTGQCTEVTSEDDSDVCNLGSLNMSRIDSKEEFQMIIRLATKFLICGTLVADLPYAKVHQTREKNRRLGLGLMGMHEWLVQRGYRYEVTPELHEWLAVYRDESDYVSRQFSAQLSISEPVAKRAIAPTGSIGILAGTTTGIEPVFAVAYKRRYLKNGTQWHYQYVVDSAAKDLIERYGVSPDRIESAIDLAKDYERRLAFQADTQDYVDQSISSTINMPSWGSELNNEDKVLDIAETLSRYAPRLRGFTVYPDGARGGQPLVSVDYAEAAREQGVEYLEHDICVIGGKGGTCGS